MTPARIAALGIALVLALLLVLLLGLGDDAEDAGGPISAGERAPAVTEDEAQVEALPGGEQPAIETVPFAPSGAPEQTAGPALGVRVLDAATRAPVGGAEVAACSMPEYTEALRRRGLVHGSPASRVLRREMSENARTQADGTARLACPDVPVLVEARHGGLWGMQYLTGLPEGPVEILLAADRELRVRVVGPQREPLSGVPIALRRRTSGERFTYKLTDTEPPDGIGVFEHLQRRFAQGDGWHATFAFPLRDQPAVPVVEDELPKEPVELRLPGAGNLDVVVRDDAGNPVGGDALAIAVAAFPSPAWNEPIWPDGPWSNPPLDASGTARVPWLGLGLHLQVTASPVDPDSARRPVVVETTGPAEPGETVTCRIVVPVELPPEQRFPTVTGRLIHRDGTPWPAVSVGVHARLFPRNPTPKKVRYCRLSEDGRFRLLVKEPCPQDGKREYRFIASLPERRGSATGCLDLSWELPVGETDVGDVVVDLGPLLVAGKVVDTDGEPVPSASLTVTSRLFKHGREFWPWLPCGGSVQSAADGTFALHAIPGEPLPEGPYRFRASRDGYLPGEPVDFGLGTRELRYVLDTGGSEVTGCGASRTPLPQSLEEVSRARAGSPRRSLRDAGSRPTGVHHALPAW